MDCGKVDEPGLVDLSDSPDLPLHDSPDSEMGKGSQPEIIDLDTYIPGQAHLQHDEISCKNHVLVVFPDICPDYLTQVVVQHNYRPESVLSTILDNQEMGESYPTQFPPESNPLKRKRGSKSSDDDYDGSNLGDEGDPECVRAIRHQMAAQGYSAIIRSAEYTALGRTLLSQEFPRIPHNFIRALLRSKNNVPGKSVFEVYTTIDEHIRKRDNVDQLWQEKKTLTKANPDFTPDGLQTLDVGRYKPEERAALAEFVAARKLRAIKDAKVAAEAEEHDNFIRAKKEGQTIDCGICFEECPLNRMVHCGGETIHWFCRKCLRTQAESLIGMAKYELTCMSLDGCSAGFSRSQRALFLNNKLTIALDRIEQEAVLRMAGIENLETCPFCPYAAEYPPVEVDKEFRCENPCCQQVSCRLCRRETHIPKTCAEVEADRGRDARHILEEAMSEALIRRCNTCQNAFVKIDGCNKIRCTKCGTLQCDVCRKTITDYSHFNDTTRGGKTGQCPLYDESQGRYEKEVSSAEAEMRQKIVAENPDLDEKTLHIPVPEKGWKFASKLKVPGFRQPLPVNIRGALGNAELVGAVGPRLGFAFQPNNLQILGRHINRTRNVDPVLPLVGIAAQPNPAPHPNGTMNIVKAVDGASREAQGTAKRKEPLVTARMTSSGPSNAMQMAAPRPMNMDMLINRVGNMTKLRLTEARRLDGEARRPNDVARPNPSLATPFLGPVQQHISQMHQARTQGVVDDYAQPHMGINFPPFSLAPGSVNSAASLLNHVGPVGPSRNSQDWDLLKGEQQLPKAGHAFQEP